MAAHQWTAGDSVFVFGKVVSPDGRPLSNARVSFAANSSLTPDYFVTGTDGLFQSCRPWHRGDEVTVSVGRAGTKLGMQVRTFDSNLVVVRIAVEARP
jgi:hypothetical protein